MGGVQGKIELYDLATDQAEQHDLAAKEPEKVKYAETLMKAARNDDPNWAVKAPRPGFPK